MVRWPLINRNQQIVDKIRGNNKTSVEYIDEQLQNRKEQITKSPDTIEKKLLNIVQFNGFQHIL